MIISPGRGYIFVHIPKTGGTSVALALEQRARADDILIGDTPKSKRRRGRVRKLTAQGRLWKHSTLADIDGVLSPAEISAHLCFCLVRNPWDRVVSYYHWLRAQRFDHPAVGLAQTCDFAAFLRHTHTQTTLQGWPYARYMRDSVGTEHGLFVRLEYMSDDLAPVIAHLGFVPDIPHENRSDRGADYRSYHTQETREIIAHVCAEDVARFGYAF
jgi:hypothetical protein